MAMIELKDVSKEYVVVKKEKGLKGSFKNLVHKETSIKKAVDHISFEIQPGEIVGYIGPNGAGKSTTVKMMSGILTPSSGEILINGISPQKDRKGVVKNLGVVFGQRTQLQWDLRLGESFELLKRIYQIPDKLYKDNLKQMNDIFEIESFIDTPVRQLSLGQRMRGDLAAAVLHSPSVLFLDEPTIGLDVDAKYSVRKFIKEINEKRNTTVILTTHDLGDIEELCKRLMIINRGKIIEDGSLSELVDRIAPYRNLVVEYYSEVHPEHPKANITSISGNQVVYQFQKNEITAAKLLEELSAKEPVLDIRLEDAKIDDIIRVAYGQ